MNTVAIFQSGPRFRSLHWSHIRSRYNGFGYVVALSLLMNLWVGLHDGAPHLLAGQPLQFLDTFLHAQWHDLWPELPGPLLIPPIVSLAPRAGVWRFVILGITAIFLGWWCLAVGDGIRFAWNWPSLGFAIDGCLSAGLVTGVCAYHIDSRAAADALARTRIDRAGLDAELQRARLRLLTAQIEPHFLFNTLAVVRALGRTDRAGTVDMLDNLVQYFRAAVPRLRESVVPLAQELELVEAYLAICRARMGDRLSYEVAAADGMGEVRIPTMVLLTLVENALKHGVAPRVEGGFIRVSATRESGALLLEVADSGQGLELRQGRGTGLANVRQRLLMTYGTAAVLSLRRAEPRGVVAGVHLPLRQP